MHYELHYNVIGTSMCTVLIITQSLVISLANLWDLWPYRQQKSDFTPEHVNTFKTFFQAMALELIKVLLSLSQKEIVTITAFP